MRNVQIHIARSLVTALVVGIALLAVSMRMWLEFTQRTRQLTSETAQAKSLMENHSARLQQMKSRIEDLKSETENLWNERSELERRVQESRSTLTQLEERFERRHPASLRVDRDDEDEDLF